MWLPSVGRRHEAAARRYSLAAARLLLTLVFLASLVLPLSADSAPPGSSPTRLRVDGRAFRAAGGSRFSWRGLTAFRLVELIAHGQQAQAVSVLDWAKAHGVTVVRVLTMADVLFKLSPDEGRSALPRLLKLAMSRGLYVEVVALADTGRIPVALDEQVKAIGAVCAAAPNCLLELANEPWARHTQSRETGDPARLRALRAVVPAGVPVSLGSASADDSDELAAGDYVTVHIAREDGDRGWRHVTRMQVAEELSARTGKPVVDDEPIGAAEASQPGRRDADPNRWFAKGVLARMLGIGATFHYEGGCRGTCRAGAKPPASTRGAGASTRCRPASRTARRSHGPTPPTPPSSRSIGAGPSACSWPRGCARPGQPRLARPETLQSVGARAGGPPRRGTTPASSSSRPHARAGRRQRRVGRTFLFAGRRSRSFALHL